MFGIPMGQKCSQFTREERRRPRNLREMGLPNKGIAGQLGRHRRTMGHELGRNSNLDDYRPDTTDRRT